MAIVAGLAYLAGARYTHEYAELHCPEGQTAQPVTIAPVYVCREPLAMDLRSSHDAAITEWPRDVAIQHRDALYLANLRVRVFDVDYVWGRYYLFALNVPPD